MTESGFFDEEPVTRKSQTGQDLPAISFDEELESAEEFIFEPSTPRPDDGHKESLGFEQNRASFQAVDDDLWVIVEPQAVVAGTKEGKSHLLPYRQRRSDWGFSFTFNYSAFHPQNYRPDSIEANFDTVYGPAEAPLLEAQVVVKRNMDWASLGFEVSIGKYKNDAFSTIVINGAEQSLSGFLNLYPVRLGGILTLDTLFEEPHFAPFVSGGVYTMLYTEEQSAVSVNGNTSYAPYFSTGALIQLDWLDQTSANISYLESGLENTFMLISARKMLASQEARDPNFESDIHVNVGLMLEF